MPTALLKSNLKIDINNIMDLSKSKYFVSGYSDDSKYGLIEKLTERIVFVAGDLDIIRMVQIIVSSKYELHIADLSNAKNYNTTLIDNTCCDAWTLSGQEKGVFDNTANTHILQDPLYPTVLENVTALPATELVIVDREFFMFVYLCEVQFNQDLEQLKFAWKIKVDLVAELANIPLPFDNGHTGIRKILYLADDLASAEAEIKAMYPEFLERILSE